MELALNILRFLLGILGLLMIPVSLIVSTPFVLFWPKPPGEATWGQTVRSRYWQVTKAGFMIAGVIAGLSD